MKFKILIGLGGLVVAYILIDMSIHSQAGKSVTTQADTGMPPESIVTPASADGAYACASKFLLQIAQDHLQKNEQSKFQGMIERQECSHLAADTDLIVISHEGDFIEIATGASGMNDGMSGDAKLFRPKK